MADARDPGHDRDHSIPAATASAEPSVIDRPALSTTTKVLISVATVLLVVWFFFAWLALDRHVLDAAGELPARQSAESNLMMMPEAAAHPSSQ